MCLDPRPDSLVRVRPASSPRPAAAAPATPPAGTATTRRASADRWLTALTDSLDARGWTLVTRAATSC